VTPRSTLPRSLRSSPWLQLSFIATYWVGECCGGGSMVVFAVNANRAKKLRRAGLARMVSSL
jgi:hypothetical protein